MRKSLLKESQVSVGDHIFLEGSILCRVEKVSEGGLITFWALDGPWQGTLNTDTGKVKLGGYEINYPTDVWYKVFPDEWDREDQSHWHYVD